MPVEAATAARSAAAHIHRRQALETTSERTFEVRNRRPAVATVLGVVAVVVAWLLVMATLAADPRTATVGSGLDARCYWLPTLANPYANSQWTDPTAYPYSPAFLQLLEPIRLLPWPAFVGVWTAILLGAVAYLTGPRLLLLGVVFAALEVAGGNIELLIAVAVVLGFRWPATWAFVLLTKVTPGVGLLWFAVRREWRQLAIALAATALVAAVSAALLPDAWRQWPSVLTSNAGRSGTWAAVPVPFVVRLPIAVVLLVWGARTDRRWVVPVATMLALPALWYGGLAILLGVLPLLPARSFDELRRVVARLPTGRASVLVR